MRALIVLVGLSIGLASVGWSGDAAFVTPPTLTLDPAGKAPLAARVDISTDIPSQVTLRVTDGVDLWNVRFPGARVQHALALFGLKPNRTYHVDVTLTPGGATDSSLTVTTAPLPDDFAALDLIYSDPPNMEPGFTLLDSIDFGPGDPRTRYNAIVDAYGDVVWYSAAFTRATRQVANGNLFYRCGSRVCEQDLYGNQYQVLQLQSALANQLHHDLRDSGDGTYLSLSRATVEVENFPTSYWDPLAPTQTATVRDEPVVEFAADGSLVNEWLMSDIIDPTRIAYDSLFVTPLGYDWVHTNAVLRDPADDSIVVSLRHQDAVVKFSRSTGELIWILGPHANWTAEFQPYLLTPVGAPFEWQYHQHAPLVTAAGNVMLFDNGTYRASPFDGMPQQDGLFPPDNYSRAVEYEIDGEAMEIRQVWEYGADIAPTIYASFLGDVDLLDETGNVLVTFGGSQVTGGVPNPELGLGEAVARIVEVTHDTPAQKVFELLVWDTEGAQALVHRSERIRSLYPADVLVSPLGPVAVGRVPDGGSVAGTPLTLDRTGAAVTLSWGRSCVSSDLDYAIYEGPLGDFSGHAPAVCSTGGKRTQTVTPDAGDRFYLVVPTNGVEEGSYGTDSGGVERDAALDACLEQMVATCPAG